MEASGSSIGIGKWVLVMTVKAWNINKSSPVSASYFSDRWLLRNSVYAQLWFWDSIAVYLNMMDLDLDLNLDGVAGAAVTSGAGTDKAATALEPESRWTSTSSIESNTDQFWVCSLEKSWKVYIIRC